VVGEVGVVGLTDHELLALAETLLAEEDDGGFEDEAHGVELEALLDFAEEVADVEPLDAAVVEQLGRAQIHRLLARLVVLPEQVVEDGAVLLVDALHLVDVLGHLLHTLQGLGQVLVLRAAAIRQAAQLLEQQRVLEDPLDRFD